MTTTADGQLNQVDLGAVGALIDTIKQQPAAAATTWSAEVRWTEPSAARPRCAASRRSPLTSPRH